jgi:hypothetical protein
MSTPFLRMPDKETSKPKLNLPEPRIWDAKRLAEFLGISVHWVFKRTQSSAEDPIPRIPGIGRLKFDTQNPRFQDWMRRQLGLIDLEGEDE